MPYGIKPLTHVMVYTMYVREEKKESDNTLIKREKGRGENNRSPNRLLSRQQR